MAIQRKFRKIGNSWGVPIPKEVFELININPGNCRYYFENKDSNLIVNILVNGDWNINERKFVKTSTLWGITIPNIYFDKYSIDPSNSYLKIIINSDKIIIIPEI